nr:reverse transcriptase domain-containing protein [Tanacetum cinerariifolium]
MEAPPSPDYIPGPEAPPLPDYIPGPEAPPSPNYILGPEYPEYLPPADDVLPAEEQPLSAAISPTVESQGYITESEPEMEPEEEDGDDEKSEGDSIEYPTSRGDDDGDDLLENDADDEDEEESSNSKEEEEEHLAPTVPAPALYSSVSASEETEPFEEGETVATPPPFGYRVAARISVQPHILMTFRSKSEVERLLAIPTPALSLVSPTSYPLPPFLMPLPIFTPLPTSSFPLPSSLPSTSGSESIHEANIPLRKRARFTTPTSGHEVGESSVAAAAAARQIRPALTIADRRRADDRLIGILRRERRYFRTLSTTYAQEIEALQRDVNTLQRQHIDDEDRLTRHIQHENTQMDVAPEDGDRVAAAMAEAEASRVGNGYGSNGSGPRLAQAVRVALTWWNSHVKTVTLEVAQALPWKTLKKMMIDKYCPRGEIKKLKTEMWELKTKGTDVLGYNHHFQELALMCDRTFPKESDRVEKYIGGVPDTIHDSAKATKPKTMQEAIEFATELMDKRTRDAVENK